MRVSNSASCPTASWAQSSPHPASGMSSCARGLGLQTPLPGHHQVGTSGTWEAQVIEAAWLAPVPGAAAMGTTPSS